ncbi:hypothetical protein [Flavobacterium sp. FlaQc-48]|uniref:hypothetical protein n=1 Tax=Flavobacterium sp. FlaQc-48 TaxID=3374181 RepID=UPI0037582EC1
MKSYKLILLLIVSFFYSRTAFCQGKIYEEQVSVKELVDPRSTELVKKENVDLQSFVESIYINSSKLYNQALPAIKKGDYFVALDAGDGTEFKRVMTSELKNIPLDKIDDLSYHKSVMYGALFGTYAEYFGIIVIKLKK